MANGFASSWRCKAGLKAAVLKLLPFSEKAVRDSPFTRLTGGRLLIHLLTGLNWSGRNRMQFAFSSKNCGIRLILKHTSMVSRWPFCKWTVFPDLWNRNYFLKDTIGRIPLWGTCFPAIALCSLSFHRNLPLFFFFSSTQSIVISLYGDTEVVLAPRSSWLLNDGSHSQYHHLNCVHLLFG